MKRIAPHILRSIPDIGTRKALEQNVEKPTRSTVIPRSLPSGTGRAVQGQPENEEARPAVANIPRRPLRRG